MEDQEKTTDPSKGQDKWVGFEKIARKTADGHGFAFQAAALNATALACNHRRDSWYFEASEFSLPEHAGGAKADAILRDVNSSIYLVIECKRIDPDYQRWVFFETEYVRRNYSEPSLIVDELKHNLRNYWKHIVTKYTNPEANEYGVGIAVNSREGNKNSRKPMTVSEAADQACRGCQGLLAHFSEVTPTDLSTKTYTVVPVVVTTAELFASNVKLENSNITDGTLPQGNLGFERVKWLYFRHHMSDGIRYKGLDGIDRSTLRSLAKSLDLLYRRTVIIVNATYLTDFLNQFHPTDVFENGLSADNNYAE